MAHRYPVHVSDKWHNAIAEGFPGAGEMFDVYHKMYMPDGYDPASCSPWLGVGPAQLNLAMMRDDIFDAKTKAAYASLNGMRVDAAVLEALFPLEQVAFNAGLQGLVPTAEELVLLGEWERSRQVLRFDPDFADAVTGSSGALQVSPGVLDRLPYDTFFVERRSKVSPASWRKASDGGIEVDPDAVAAGFFVYRTAMVLNPEDPFELKEQLCLIWVDASGKRICHEMLSTECRSIGEMIDEADAYMDAAVDDMRRTGVLSVPGDDECSSVNASLMPGRRKRIEDAMSLLLYLCTMEPEYEAAAPGGSPKAMRKKGKDSGLTGDTPVTVVGARIGDAIRAHLASGESDGGGEGGRTVRPHVRRGHFHRHWRGSGDGKELVVMWHAPTFVNAEFGTAQGATVLEQWHPDW